MGLFNRAEVCYNKNYISAMNVQTTNIFQSKDELGKKNIAYIQKKNSFYKIVDTKIERYASSNKMHYGSRWMS